MPKKNKIKTKLDLRYMWCRNKFIPAIRCHDHLFSGYCSCREGVKKRIMASKARLKKHLKELGVDFEARMPTLELARRLVNEVKEIGHADNFSPELRKTLINDYYFKIYDERRYGAFQSRYEHPRQLVWNSRKWNRDLKYLRSIRYGKRPVKAIVVNRLFCLFEMTVCRRHYVWRWCLKRDSALFYAQKWLSEIFLLPVRFIRTAIRSVSTGR